MIQIRHFFLILTLSLLSGCISGPVVLPGGATYVESNPDLFRTTTTASEPEVDVTVDLLSMKQLAGCWGSFQTPRDQLAKEEISEEVAALLEKPKFQASVAEFWRFDAESGSILHQFILRQKFGASSYDNIYTGKVGGGDQLQLLPEQFGVAATGPFPFAFAETRDTVSQGSSFGFSQSDFDPIDVRVSMNETGDLVRLAPLVEDDANRFLIHEEANLRRFDCTALDGEAG